MSKTWTEQSAWRTSEAPQKLIDRLRMREAEEDIREATTHIAGDYSLNSLCMGKAVPDAD
jgi:hypothetical protein